MLKLTGKEQLLLTQRANEHRLRSLRNVTPVADSVTEVVVNGSRLINFASNDYLGLSQHPLLKQRAIEYTQKFGAGSGASRLLSGNLDCFDKLERQLAKLKGTEAAIIFNSGYQTNLTVLSCLTDGKARVLLDRLSHNSLLQGALSTRAKWSRYEHNDLADLKTRLVSDPEQQDRNTWIVTESVFSMDGDRADLQALAALSQATGARLYVDEAHATGVLGAQGMGLASGIPGVEIIMGTFGKAAGSFGAYIACSTQMREYLINFCAGLIYSTALPPAVLGAIDAALDLIPDMDIERARLMQCSDAIRSDLNSLGFDTLSSSTQIIPVITGSDKRALGLSQFLESEGILAPAIRPPTVPEGEARIRLSVTAAHTDAQIAKLLQSVRNWKRRHD